MNKHTFLLLALSLLAPCAHAQLTRIIQTGDAIPDSPGLTAGTVFRHPRIDHGQVTFFTDHTEFGVTVPSNSLLYWDGTSLTKIANDDTPVPGLGGETLRFNDITGRNTLSIDGSANPTVNAPEVVFYASYQADDNIEDGFTLYRWRPDTGLSLVVRPGAALSHVQSGVIAEGKIIFRTQQLAGPESNRGLYQIDSNGVLTKILSPDDDIPGVPNSTFTFVQPDFYFNGTRILANINTTPTSLGGWWDLRFGASLGATSIFTVNDDLTTPDFRAFTVSPRGLSPFSTVGASIVGVANGVTGNNTPSQALVCQSNPGAPFKVFSRRGNPTPGAPGYAYQNFTNATTRAGFLVFAATSLNPQSDQIVGIYQTAPQGITTIVDTQTPLDGKMVASFELHDRDPSSVDAILFTAHFEDNTSALYALPVQSVAFDYSDWTMAEFPDANGDPMITGFFEDPDEDDVLNVVEYALGGSGNIPDQETTTPVLSATAEFEYTRRTELPAELIITPEVTNSLMQDGWQSGPAVIEEVSMTPVAGNPDLTKVRVRCPNAQSVLFFRVKVSVAE